MKILLQNVVGAFLKNKDNYLLIKRSKDKKIAPGAWSCIGGHIEPNEFRDPMTACIREIEEETSIREESIFNLKLRYIITRRDKNIIRQNYVYFGETNEKNFVDTREGKLNWVPKAEILEKKFTQKYKKMVEHFVNTPDPLERIVAGIAQNFNGELRIEWTVLEDFE